jgi:hypothetical protein
MGCHVQFSAGEVTRAMQRLDAAARRAVHRAAHDVIASMERWARRGESSVSMAVGRRQPAVEWAHYREAGPRAVGGGYHFYYHSHAAGRPDDNEHGHFHVFLPGRRGALTQVAAIAMDVRGMPRRIFATNRWVTDEHWQSAHVITRRVHALGSAHRSTRNTLARWLGATITLFLPQIAAVLARRDARLDATGRMPRVLEDRRMHVVSDCRVSLATQLAALDALHTA